VNALIIVAHGSRNRESARQVAALCQRMSGKIKNRPGDSQPGRKKSDPDQSDPDQSDQVRFDVVVPAFLQFSSPLLEDAIDDLVQRGAGRIVVFPFFIAAGSHLLNDIPELVEKAGKVHPGVKFFITRHLGGIDSIEDIILGEVETYLSMQA